MKLLHEVLYNIKNIYLKHLIKSLKYKVKIHGQIDEQMGKW